MKLYRPLDTEYSVKAQKSVMLAGLVICMGLCAAFTVLCIDMLREGHRVAGWLAAVPDAAAAAAGVAFALARARYSADLKRMKTERAEDARSNGGQGEL